MKFLGPLIVDWVYSQQCIGRLKWLPTIGEVSGFVWIAVIEVVFWGTIIGLALKFF